LTQSCDVGEGQVVKRGTGQPGWGFALGAFNLERSRRLITFTPSGDIVLQLIRKRARGQSLRVLIEDFLVQTLLCRCRCRCSSSSLALALFELEMTLDVVMAIVESILVARRLPRCSTLSRHGDLRVVSGSNLFGLSCNKIRG